MILRIAAVLLLGAVVWLLTRIGPTAQVPGLARVAAVETHQPGYYMRGAELTEFGEDGRRRLVFAAASAEQDASSGLMRAEHVRLDYFPSDEQAWRLEAAHGTMPRGDPRVLLWGDVVMTGRRGGRPDRAIVHTDRLTVDTRLQQATTELPVSVSLGQHVLDARGLAADLKAGTLRLESSVNGRFNP